jgi:hypothetical protein
MILSRLRKIRLTLCMTSMASSLFLSAHATSAQVPPSGEKQKISEGRYVRLKDNLKVEGSEQNWIFWRLSGGGYELEDHFQLHTDPAAQLLSQMGGAKISPDLRKEMESKTAETDFVVRYGPDRRPLALTAHGKNLVDGKTIEMVKCEISAKEVRCHGRGQHAKLRGQGSLEFFYAFPFPMLLSRWLVSSPAESPVNWQFYITETNWTSRRPTVASRVWQTKPLQLEIVNFKRTKPKLFSPIKTGNLWN